MGDEGNSVELSARTVNIIALTITFVWAASFIADIIWKESYDPSPYVHLVMMTLAGSAFARNLFRKGNPNGDE